MPESDRKAIVYIDGFNLYYGMKEKFGRKYSWLNLEKFAQSLIPVDSVLVQTRYFTSKISGDMHDPNKHLRQKQYLLAIKTLYPRVEIIEGNYQSFQSHCKHCDIRINCHNCGTPHVKPNEKKTDVNIATSLLVDAFEDKCDVQVLVSGDSDYENTLKELRRIFPAKSLIVAFPPRRRNNKLNRIEQCSDSFDILEDSLANNQFESELLYKNRKGKKIKISKPESWN